MKLKWEVTAATQEIEVLQGILGAEEQMPIMAEECSGAITLLSAKLPFAEVNCSAKNTCRDMSIFDEAKTYLIQCGMKNLDRVSDGIPYEA